MDPQERRMAQLEDENGKLRAELAKVSAGTKEFEILSGVNKDFVGYVKVQWGTEIGQLTPKEARGKALYLLEAAEEAESDARVLRTLKEVGLEIPVVFSIAGLIRADRDKS